MGPSTHTWSDRLVPLIWCATSDNACEQLRQALSEADDDMRRSCPSEHGGSNKGYTLLRMRFHYVLNSIARQLRVRGPPMRCYQYLQAPVQEHIAALSGAEYLVGRDLVRAQQATGRSQSGGAPATARDELEGSRMATDTERNSATRPRTSTAYHSDEEPETGNRNVVERLQRALEHYRRGEEQRTRDEASRQIQECFVWLTNSRGGTEQIEQVLTASAVGTRANSAMHDWWTRHDVESPSQACAYIQGINQSAHPGEVFGKLSAQAIEDLIQAGGASDMIMQDLTTEQSSQEEAHRRFDEDLVSRIRGRLLNQQCLDDGEAWLINSAWLTLPSYCQATLEPVLNEIGIDDAPFARLNPWLAQKGIRNPRDMSRRLDEVGIPERGDSKQEEDELNARITHLLGSTGLVTEFRRAIESGLNNRRRRDPQPPDANEDTCNLLGRSSRRRIRHSHEMAAMRTYNPQDLPRPLDLRMSHARQSSQMSNMQARPTWTDGRGR